MNDEITVKRTAKDSVFTHLFRDRRYVLKLYRALHPEAADVTEDMIEIVTLENVLVDGAYNDLGFTVGSRLVSLVEAQSTWSYNILVRAMLYLAQTYQDYIKKREIYLYGSKKAELPRPELYVIYTGSAKIKDGTISLSKEFFDGQQTDLEVTAHVLTNGSGNDIIYQYVAFTKILDEQVRKYGRTSEAAAETIRICEDRDILRDYLMEHEREVEDIMITLFDNDQILSAYTKEKVDFGRAEGIAQGMERGIAKGRAEGIEEGYRRRALSDAGNFLREGVSADIVARATGLSLDEVNALK